jgi:hypothetical protein
MRITAVRPQPLPKLAIVNRAGRRTAGGVLLLKLQRKKSHVRRRF